MHKPFFHVKAPPAPSAEESAAASRRTTLRSVGCFPLHMPVQYKKEVDQMNPEKIGLLIAALRKEKHMTQRAVAAALQVSEKTISKWETGVSHS